MSWCRWGSRCTSTTPAYKVDEECRDCPGSDVYVYESTIGLICCGCFLTGGEGFICQTEVEMFKHLLEHDKAGHHVRRSLLERAKGNNEPEVSEDWARLRGIMTP